MKTLRQLLLTLCLAAAFASCQQHYSPLPPTSQFFAMCDFSTGNLIFIRDTTGMGSAIQSATALDTHQLAFTHVAITECTDSGVFVIDATPALGVARRPLNDFIAAVWDTNSDYSFTSIAQYYYVDVPYDTATLLARLHSLTGLPYDPYFLPHNGRLYCSELVQECFLDPEGNPLFPSKPMNFLASDGTLPAYWQHHFDSLGTAVPQGTPGTNPNDMSRSPILHPFKIQ